MVVAKRKRTGSMVAVLVLVAASLATVVGAAAPAQSAAFTVNTTLDTTDLVPGNGLCRDAAAMCSLRAAIQEANALAGPDTITLGPSTYTLSIAGVNEDLATTGDLDITDSLAINGAGSGATTINGGGVDRVFHYVNGVGPAWTYSMTGVTITGGKDFGDGGGVSFRPDGAAELSLSDVTISGNSAFDGGGIWTARPVVMTSVSITNNTANQNGGGVFVFPSFPSGTLTMTNTTVSGNKADFDGDGGGDGGAIYNLSGNHTVTITDSTIGAIGNPNTAANGGGIYNNGGRVTITRSTVGGNQAALLGGGIYSRGAAGTLELTNSTISGNSAGAGGGLYNTIGATATATNSTFAFNTATANDGGYRNFASLTLKATIVANNTAPSGPDCGSAATSAGYNLIGSSSGCGAFVPGVTDQVDKDPKLGPLADNGGPFTHALLETSPAINAIPPASCAVTTDERGVARPQGPACDIGAYEAQFAPTVGLVDVGTGTWYLRNSAGVVTSFVYGNPVDLPISGDWDGNGTSTPGLYRQSDGFFYARNSNSTGIADAACFAGDPSDIPVVGDWDNDGDDNLGIYRSSEQKFYLFTISCANASMGAAQIVMGFGNPGDKPVAGDWDGDGIDEVGLHRESTGFFYWRNTLDTGIASGEIFFGDPNDRFTSGDWGIVNGIDTPASFRPGDLTFYFRHTLTQGNADSQFAWAGAGSRWLPVSGMFGLG